MGNYKQHVLFGLVCSFPVILLFFYLKLPINVFLLIPISFIYSQLPDIDTQASKIRMILTLLGVGLSFIELVFFKNYSLAIVFSGLTIIIWIMNLIKGFGHRGITHTIICGLLLSSIMLFISLECFIIALISYMSHLVLDKRKNN